jgi:glycosyltransferase involved in cell wall biosynthesis
VESVRASDRTTPLSLPERNDEGSNLGEQPPAISLIIAVDEIDAGVERSVTAMFKAVAGVPVEIIIASREFWPEAPAWARVVAYNAASRGDRLDRAAEHAQGDVLAFTDSRVRLPADWAHRLVEVFADPSVAVAGGPVLPRAFKRSERVAALITDRFIGGTPTGHTSRAARPRPVRELPGANLAVRRHLFWAAGGFQSPSAGGEAVRLCYKVRSLLNGKILFDPTLAVRRTPRGFPGAFLTEVASYGQARGDLARRCPDVSPLRSHALPTILALFVALEVSLVSLHDWNSARLGGIVLGSGYLVAACRVLFSRGRLGDRLLAILGLPLVPLTNGLAFLRGYLGPSLGEVSPLRTRRRPLRILIINWRDVTHPWAGGAETYMHEIGRRWAADGMDVGWLCQRHKGSARTDLIDGIRFHRAGGRLTLYPMVALLYALRLRGCYDVIVDCENGIPFFTPLFARIPRVLVVHHVHREIFRQQTRPPMRWLGTWLEGRLMPRVYRHTQVVAVSASTRSDLLSLGFDADRINVVHNGVHPASPVATPPSAQPSLLCMGRLTPQKSVDVLIRALPAVLAQFPNTRLDIVGQGPDRRRLERLAWSLRLADHIRFHGHMPGIERDRIAARAWIAVSPSSFEGWGVTCLEAGARSLPVVASNVAGLRDAVRDGETGVLVPHGDSASLALALVALIGDPERRRQMGAAGLRWAALHSWERSARELGAVLQVAAAGSRIEPAMAGWPRSLALGEGVVEDLDARDAG